MLELLKNYRDKFLSPVTRELAALHEDMRQLTASRPDSFAGVNACRREAMAEKWRALDCLERALPDDFPVTCEICGAVFSRNKTVRFKTDCRFSGGQLVRYQCPQCGAIVGPLKMLLLSEDALAADYRSHYAIYEEGDSTEAEMRTFFAMKPRLDGTYLNYGAGCWSKTLPALRGKGFHVFGYDPYSADGGAEGILTTPQELTAMKFDGIFSNNLLEHLRHPVSDIKMMKNFLNSGGYSRIRRLATSIFTIIRASISYFTQGIPCPSFASAQVWRSCRMRYLMILSITIMYFVPDEGVSHSCC